MTPSASAPTKEEVQAACRAYDLHGPSSLANADQMRAALMAAALAAPVRSPDAGGAIPDGWKLTPVNNKGFQEAKKLWMEANGVTRIEVDQYDSAGPRYYAWKGDKSIGEVRERDVFHSYAPTPSSPQPPEPASVRVTEEMVPAAPMRVDTAALLERVMSQAEADLAAAHEEICKLQGLDPKTHSWPEWSSPANTIRWFATIRERLRPLSTALASAEPEGWKLVPVAFLDFVKTAPVSSGVCCCGDDMEKHTDPMSCGHSPVDQWNYSLSSWLRQIAAAPSHAEEAKP